MYLKVACLSLFTIVFSITNLNAQKRVENNFGLHIAGSVYQDFEPKVPVRAYFATNLEVGFDFTHYYQQDRFFKTGISYTFYKSPFKNDLSYYDEYIQIPFVFSIAKLREFKHRNKVFMTFGPQISIQSRQGKAERGDKFYNFDESNFGGAIKFGLTGEIALYQKMTKYAHAGGLRLSTDIPKLVIRTQDNLTVYDQYITATLFYSISKRSLSKRRSAFGQ